MRRAALAVWAAAATGAAGCDRWQTCAELADWAMPFEHDSSFVEHEGAQGVISRAPDGTLLLVTNDPMGDIKLGELGVSGTVIARISTTGKLTGIAPVPDITAGVAGSLRIAGDSAGGVVLAEGLTGLRSYGPDLQKRWTFMTSVSEQPAMAVSAEGHVAFAGMEGGGYAVYFLEPDGTVRWKLPDSRVFAKLAQFDDNGDVHIYGSATGSRFVHLQLSAVDGAVLVEAPIEIPATSAARDGSSLGTQFDQAGQRAILLRFEADGTRRWAREFDALEFGGAVIADNGDVVVQTTITGGTGVVSSTRRLHAKTGDTTEEARSCQNLDVIGADANHVYVMGRPGGPSVGIARFSL